MHCPFLTVPVMCKFFAVLFAKNINKICCGVSQDIYW